MDDFREQAERRVRAVEDDPQGRLQLADRFYRDFGAGGGRTAWLLRRSGVGRAAQDFLRWEIERGVLNGPQHHRRGSAWWRAINRRLLLDAEEARLIYEAHGGRVDPPRWRRWLNRLARRSRRLPGAPPPGSRPSVDAWLRFLQDRSASSWYLAHNASVADAYLEHLDLAQAESPAEQALMNLVLYRVLVAQAMAQGVMPLAPHLSRLVAHPRLPAVGIAVAAPRFYPRRYPLDDADLVTLLHGGDPSDLAGRVADSIAELVQPGLAELFDHAAQTLALPRLREVVSEGRLNYPNLGPYAGDVIRAAVPAGADAVFDSLVRLERV